jgi:hypothetical protein
MSLRTFYNQFVEALGRTFPNPIHIAWNDKNYIMGGCPFNTEQLTTALKQQEVSQEVIDKVVELLPHKKSITLYQKSHMTLLPSPQDYCLIGDWIILYH